MLAISTLRQDAPAGLDAATGQGLEAVYEWAFRLGPGFVVGVGNGLILGWLMYTSQLVPRGLAIVGLIGGPLLLIAAVLVLFDVIEGGKTIQGLMSLPEAFWELSIGVYLIVKGYRPSAITEYMEPSAAQAAPH